jgi:hypothetical protein
MQPPPAKNQGDQAKASEVLIDATPAQLTFDVPGDANHDQADVLMQSD